MNMGDRPAGAIATEAMYKTAEMFKTDHPRAAEMLREGSYVDDLMDSVPTMEEAKDLAGGAEKMLLKGGFMIKFWLYSGDHVEEEDGITQLLGVCWKSGADLLCYQTSLNFSIKKHGVHIHPDLKVSEVPAGIPTKLTKRLVLSQIMRIYDPLGLLSPFTIYGKVLLGETWELETGWDDAIPGELREKWVKFLTSFYDLNELAYPRALKPKNATVVESDRL